MILVTGATGTSGVEITKALLARTSEVRVLARDPEKAAKLLGDEVEISRGDFNDVESLKEAMEGVERAMLLSAPTQDQVQMQSNFIRAAKEVGVRQVVKLSAANADSKSKLVFMRWHGITEDELKASGMAWTMLRPPNFMQNLLGMAGMIKGGTIYAPTGEGKSAFVDVRDIAAVAAAALTEAGHEGKSYEVTGPEALSYADVAATFSKVLGKPVKFVDVPLEAAKQSMMQGGMPEWLADAVNELSQAQREGKFGPVSDVVERMGKKRPITLGQFIQDHRAAFA